MQDNTRNEACLVEFDNMKRDIRKLQEEQERKDDIINVIEKAIVAIQIANEQTALTLSKLDEKLECASKLKRDQFWSDDTKKAAMRNIMIITIVIILALVGTNMIEGIQGLPL